MADPGGLHVLGTECRRRARRTGSLHGARRTAQNARRMVRKLLPAAALLVLALAGTVAVLLLINAAPVLPAVSAAAATAASKPYVIKLHARWCPYCMLTKDEWARIEQTYAGRVNLIVWDFTSEEATERSRADADRLNLRQLFDEYAGATGLVVVLDGQTRAVTAEIGGNRGFDDYRAAIDAALARPPAASP